MVAVISSRMSDFSAFGSIGSPRPAGGAGYRFLESGYYDNKRGSSQQPGPHRQQF
jgi:hypothetical protein